VVNNERSRPSFVPKIVYHVPPYKERTVILKTVIGGETRMSLSYNSQTRETGRGDVTGNCTDLQKVSQGETNQTFHLAGMERAK